jgi:hypothetical protein
MKRFLLTVLVLTGLALCSCATMNPVVPLPNDILIVSPNSNLSPEIKAFSGKWGGRWWNPSGNIGDGNDAVLIIEKIINERQVIVVYAWGDSFAWNITKGWARFNMNISRNEEGKLVLSSSSSRGRFEIRVEKDKLEGIFRGHFTNFITMKKRIQ